MEIRTKYNIGDKVWIIYAKNGVFGCLQCRISDIEIKTTEKRTRITYGLTVPQEDCDDIIRCEYEIEDRYEERFVFPTKEELLKSL